MLLLLALPLVWALAFCPCLLSMPFASAAADAYSFAVAVETFGKGLYVNKRKFRDEHVRSSAHVQIPS